MSAPRRVKFKWTEVPGFNLHTGCIQLKWHALNQNGFHDDSIPNLGLFPSHDTAIKGYNWIVFQPNFIIALTVWITTYQSKYCQKSFQMTP